MPVWIRNASNGAPPHYRTLHLELQPRPMSREHARPQSPAGSRRYGEGAKEPARAPVGPRPGPPTTEPEKDYGEHIDYKDGHMSWPIRIRPRIGRHSYSVNTWRDRFAGLS